MTKDKKETKKSNKEKGISLHPLKPEEALSAFMKVDPKDYKEWLKNQKQ